ncbi:hypothetical protein MTY_0305 [Moorella thermoacetica Y72]|uniref:Nuclease SbcCD subunit C n=1 Tax=Moorella thermoacetica Y72 TaxID=1325331 RepID=A0A0S6U7B2_NEOTH|nr:AAA family ATPase [Moorella thermoacetica]GAF24977.1 hypothetical protein MTY_0305 [Moorella thermoacetica Y72]
MIKRVEFITQFGIFRDFRWHDNLPEFAKLNLIYGWNYSGKTTLSRIFQALEHKKLSTEYSAAHFQLLTEDGSQMSSTDLSASPAVRVFNRDYVEANFSGDYSAPSIFIVGEENIALRKRLEQLTKRRARVERIARDFSEKQKAITNELDKLGTDKARDIRHLLGDPRFERPKLNQRIEEVRHNPAIYIMADDDVSARLSTLKSGDQFSSVLPVSGTLPDFVLLTGEVNELLNQTASQWAIERLKQNREVESWVRQGLLLHKDASTCEFCGGALTTARLEELRGHFSEEYENLVKEIEDKIRHINTVSLNPVVPDEMRILPEFRQSFSQITSQLYDWIQWATALRDQLTDALKQKQVAIERQRKWEGDLGRAAQGQQLIETLNQIIEQHNRAISTIDKAKEEAKTALERHYAARHFQESGIAQKEADIHWISGRLERTKEILRRIESQIQKIEQRIKESSVGATKLNCLLRYLLPGNNIEAVSVGDDQFQFHRDGSIATHLSDGEKTAVTFAYFLTSLEAKGATLSDMIVFVDDPVSSLDSNHIYAVYALLAERLENSRQLFVSTHNSELFNLLKSKWLDESKGGRNKKDTRAYHVWRSVSPIGTPQAELLDLPPLLRQFKSEYEFIFSQLYNFAKTTAPSLHEAFTAPNLLRKFLEAYLGFRKPSVRSWSKKLELLLDSPNQRREIQKFADDASHLQALGRSLQHPDFVPNAQRCVKMVLDALERKDRDHYESLCEVIKEAGA